MDDLQQAFGDGSLTPAVSVLVITGSPMGHPKSASFGTIDLVGLDTLAFVARHSHELLPHDEARDLYRIPDVLQTLLAAGRLGEKSGAGFYRKQKGAAGKQILAWDWQADEYRLPVKPAFPCLAAAKQAPDAAARLRAVVGGQDAAATLAWRNLRDTLIYAFNRVREIAEEIVEVDRAMRWGFSWELGPFELFDAIGVAEFVRRAGADGVAVPAAL